MYRRLDSIVDRLKNEIVGVSKFIHSHPELQFREFESSKHLVEQLRNHHFDVEDGVGGYETAFRGVFNKGASDYKIAVLAEYDALPEIDHACGHNLIAAVAFGTAVALSQIAVDHGFEVVIIGTPAEEGGHGGKIKLIDAGVFDDIDFALMLHPATSNMVARGSRANARFSIEFRGKACHSSRPENGINAVNAMIQCINALDNQRHIMPFKSTFNGIITHGGTADNVVPDYARCQYSVRVAKDTDLEIVFDKLRNIISGVEKMTGAKGTLNIVPGYAACKPSVPMAYRYRDHMIEFGETFRKPNPDGLFGSSDIGNVSVKIPTIHGYFNIQEHERIESHNLSFTKAAVTDYAHDQTIKSIKALARTILDMHISAGFRQEIIDYYEENR